MDNRNGTTSVDEGTPTFLGESLKIKGEMKGEEPLRIAGRFEGLLEFPNQLVTIEKKGCADSSTIMAGQVIVHGELRGNVIVTERLEICDGASLSGEAEVNRLIIEDGAHIQAKIATSKGEAE